ncbi:MAG TPA: GIY-YIG nuclease family protein [Rhizomicrobium sp.]
MSNARRKELLREYKETPQHTGVFVVVCGDTRWTGFTRNLDKQQNSLWFQLRMGKYPNAELQKIWNEKGESAFAYEILEEVKDENVLIIGELLKEREAVWRQDLGANKVSP